ncbi:hypothetical protein BGX24_012343, partial [Mortierella sp. AD032]
MAIKTKKRKLTASGRSAVGATSAASQAEAELAREEEEMLAITRHMKKVDENEAVSFAKKMMQEASRSSETSSIAGTESVDVNGHSENSVIEQQHETVGRSSHLNGSASATNGSTAGSKEQDGAHWVGNLTVENVEKQNDTHERERQEQSQDQDRDTTSAQQEPTTASTADDSQAVNESGESVAKRSSVRASLRKPTQPQDGQNGTSTDGGSSRPVRVISSTRSDVSDAYSSSGSHNSLAATLPVIFRPDEAEGSASAIVSGFEMPLKELTQPRLSHALITRKARTIYAPETVK